MPCSRIGGGQNAAPAARRILSGGRPTSVPCAEVKVWLELKRRKPPSMDGKGMDVPPVLFMPDRHHICEYELEKTALHPNA